MEQAELDHQLQMQESYQNQLKELRQQFGKQDLQAQETMYLNGLDNLYKQGLIKEEEYQRMKLEISKQFAAQRASQDAEDHGAGSAQIKSIISLLRWSTVPGLLQVSPSRPAMQLWVDTSPHKLRTIKTPWRN